MTAPPASTPLRTARESAFLPALCLALMGVAVGVLIASSPGWALTGWLFLGAGAGYALSGSV